MVDTTGLQALHSGTLQDPDDVDTAPLHVHYTTLMMWTRPHLAVSGSVELGVNLHGVRHPGNLGREENIGLKNTGGEYWRILNTEEEY